MNRKLVLPLVALFVLSTCASPQVILPLPTATVQPGGSIQAAVNAAPAGETIIVPVGTGLHSTIVQHGHRSRDSYE